MLLNPRIHLILSIVFIYFMISLNGSFWPPAWPDEVLFSNPAGNLAVQGEMITTVLKGLVPGMEKATLWNSPLYMILLSGVYLFFGEGLSQGRGLSLALGILVLVMFRDFIRILATRNWVQVLGIWILALDLTFLRAMNTIRMDILALLFVLLTVKVLYKNGLERDEKSELISTKVRGFYLAGIYTGLAAMSHPFAVVLIPIWLIYCYRMVRGLLLGLLGILTALIPWGFYIVSYPGVFFSQFLSQIGRKLSFLGFSAGPVGAEDSMASTMPPVDNLAVFKTFASQYGENGRWFMLLILASFAFSLVLAGGFLFRKRKDPGIYGPFRLYLTGLMIFGMIYISSEMWYAVYASVFFVLAMIGVTRLDNRKSTGILLLFPVFFSFAASLVAFEVRHPGVEGRDRAITLRYASIEKEVGGCDSIFLRTIPDPYFHLVKKYPEKRIYEFIPARLRFSAADKEKMTETYSSIDCFILNSNSDWSPVLSHFLESTQNEFTILNIPESPGLEEVRILRRNKDEFLN